MGIVRRQSIESSIFIYLGFIIGAFNVLVLFTHYLTAEQYGLITLLLNAGLLLSTLATLGTVPVINKFFPFYNAYLKPQNNDLPFLTIVICIIGFGLFVVASIIFKPLVIRKFGGNSSLFVHYFFLLYPLTFFLLLFSLLESYAWGLKKTVLSNFLKETSVRVYSTILILILAIRWFSFDAFIKTYSFLFAVPCFFLLANFIKSGHFKINPKLSPVTRRLKGKMISFSAYVFSGNVFNLLAKTAEYFFISSINGLTQTGLYSIGDYVTRFLEIPQRSMGAITIPLLATHWKDKAHREIETLYKKSTITLLISGLFIFGVIWLNVNNFIRFLPGKFSDPAIKTVILIFGIGKLIDLGTGINNQIIQTSNYWKFDFYSNIFFTSVSIPMNFWLVHKYGMIGAAFTYSISLTLFNLMRFIFIWITFKFQPFSWKILLALIVAFGIYYLTSLIPFISNIYIDTIIRTFIFSSIFMLIIIKGNFSEDINQLWEKWSLKIFGRKLF